MLNADGPNCNLAVLAKPGSGMSMPQSKLAVENAVTAHPSSAVPARRHQQELSAHEQTRAALQAETIDHCTAERLAENETHRQSLEEKHVHARDALEHYRQSVKEQQPDLDQCRHEQQV